MCRCSRRPPGSRPPAGQSWSWTRPRPGHNMTITTVYIYCCYYLPTSPQRVSGVRRWRPGWRQWQWGTCPRCRTASRSPWTPWRQYLNYLRCTQREPITLWTVKAFLELQLWPMHTSYLFHLDNHMLCRAGGLEGTHSKTVPNPFLFQLSMTKMSRNLIYLVFNNGSKD